MLKGTLAPVVFVRRHNGESDYEETGIEGMDSKVER